MMDTGLDPSASWGFVDAASAANRLGIRLASLYAYASRGLVRTQNHPADPRARLYSAADIDALVRRKARGRRPTAAAATALDWGLPVIETRISQIADGRLSYRGIDAVTLAESASLEDVARLLWKCGDDDPFPAARGHHPEVPRSADSGATIPERAMLALSRQFVGDIPGLPLPRLREQAAKLLGVLSAAVAGAPTSQDSLHAALAHAWRRPAAAETIRRALVLCADHELNASAFAVRVIASTGASLTASLVGGLAALSGPRHGCMTDRAAAFFDESEKAGDPVFAVRARLARGETIPGFGHPLYRDGDPRAAGILSAVPPAHGLAGIVAAVEDAVGLKPTVDAALVILERSQRLPRGAAFGIFAVGRAVGWIAHALEQRETGQLIRPRATYVGN